MTTASPALSQSRDTVLLEGFSTRLMLELSLESWADLVAFLNWLARQNATLVYLLHRSTPPAMQASLHIDDLPADRLSDWLKQARASGVVHSARFEHLLVRQDAGALAPAHAGNIDEDHAKRDRPG